MRIRNRSWLVLALVVCTFRVGYPRVLPDTVEQSTVKSLPDTFDPILGAWTCESPSGNAATGTEDSPAIDFGTVVYVLYDTTGAEYHGIVLAPKPSWDHTASRDWTAGCVRWVLTYHGSMNWKKWDGEHDIWDYRGFQVRHVQQPTRPGESGWFETYYPCEVTVERSRAGELRLGVSTDNQPEERWSKVSSEEAQRLVEQQLERLKKLRKTAAEK